MHLDGMNCVAECAAKVVRLLRIEFNFSNFNH
jgi:hypothetical protein